MNLFDCLLLTLVNAVICITLPKLLSLVLPKTKPVVQDDTAPSSLSSFDPQEFTSPVPVAIAVKN